MRQYATAFRPSSVGSSGTLVSNLWTDQCVQYHGGTITEFFWPANIPPVFRSRFDLRARIRGMGTRMNPPPNQAMHLIEQLRARDRRAVGELFDFYHDRLRGVLGLCVGPRPRARLDARWMGGDLSDVYKHQFRRLWEV
jgi:hypothetical protein